MKRENDYEQTYREAIEASGGRCLKVQVLGRQGYPDRLVLRGLNAAVRRLRMELDDGLYIGTSDGTLREVVEKIIADAIHFTEMKKPGGTFQPKQPQIIRELRAMGYRVDVVNGELE